MNVLLPWSNVALSSGLYGQSKMDSWYKAVKDKTDFLIAHDSDTMAKSSAVQDTVLYPRNTCLWDE